MLSMPIPPHLVGALPLISASTPPSWISINFYAIFPSPLQTKNFYSSKNTLFPTYRCYSSSKLSGNNVGSSGGGSRDESFAIEGRNLNFSITRKKRLYGGGQAEELVPILNDCSIRIPTGQLWMLLGPNGCGKSTLLKVLAGLITPTDGYVYIKRPKSFVFQNPDHQVPARKCWLKTYKDGILLGVMQVVMPTVEADVAFGLGKFNLTPQEVQTRVQDALEAVGMLEYLHRPVQTLSGGQKQRVAIAGALAESCEVLLLDELTTFLDENDQKGVLDAVKNSLGGPREVAALWVTHRLEELDYADGAVYMENGRVIMHGDVQSIRRFLNKKLINYMDLINS